MEKVRIDDVEPLSPPDEEIPDGMMADSVRSVRKLSDPLGTTDVAINHFQLEGGRSTNDVAINQRHRDGEVVVEAGELLRLPPETFQLGTNREDEPATALALGAPREYEEGGRWLLECADCGEYTAHETDELDAGTEVYRCTDCGSVFTPSG